MGQCRLLFHYIVSQNWKHLWNIIHFNTCGIYFSQPNRRPRIQRLLPHPTTCVQWIVFPFCLLVIYRPHPWSDNLWWTSPSYYAFIFGKFISQTPVDCNSFKHLWKEFISLTPTVGRDLLSSPEHLCAINRLPPSVCYYSNAWRNTCGIYFTLNPPPSVCW